jgi:hypothetical protein
MKIDCAHDELLDINSPKLIRNPKNNNRHSVEQIERLAKIIEFQGMRAPIVISKLSGFIVKGHCRLEALSLLYQNDQTVKIPVNYQDYVSEGQEYADMTADNEIARWAEFDLHKAIVDLKDIDVGDIDLLGFEDSDFIANSISLEPIDEFSDFLDKDSDPTQKIVTLIFCKEDHDKFIQKFEASRIEDESIKDFIFRVVCG